MWHDTGYLKKINARIPHEREAPHVSARPDCVKVQSVQGTPWTQGHKNSNCIRDWSQWVLSTRIPVVRGLCSVGFTYDISKLQLRVSHYIRGMVSSERLICPFDMQSTSISNYKYEAYKGALFVLAASNTLHSVWRDVSQRNNHRCSSVPWVGVQAFYSTYCSSLRFLCTISREVVGNVSLRLGNTHNTYGITYYI